MRWLESSDLGLVLVALIGLIGSLAGGQKVKDALSKKAPPPTIPDMVEVAGAIVSDKAASEWIKATNALTAGITVLTTKVDRSLELMEANRDILRANTKAAEGVAHEARELGEVMSDLSKELEFQSRLKGKA